MEPQLKKNYFTWAFKSVEVGLVTGESVAACGEILVPVCIPGHLETMIRVRVQLPEDDFWFQSLRRIVGVSRAVTVAGLYCKNEDKQCDLNGEEHFGKVWLILE